jgi:DNA-binding CsgD family transcriptional regulator
MLRWSTDQLGAISGAISRAASGIPTLLVVEGEPGTGKTALLDEVMDRAGEFHVLAGDGLETGEQAPFSVLAQWGVDVTSGSGVGALSSPVAGQRLRALIDARGVASPVMLRIDDLQWADPESVETLIGLLSRMSGDRVLACVASRPLAPGVLGAWQRWVTGRDRGIRILLSGLSLTDAIELSRAKHPGLSEQTARDLWQHTSGNPLYLTALLAEHEADALTRMSILPAPAEFARLLGTRTAQLLPQYLEMLRAAAVLGAGWLSVPDLAELCEIEDPTAAAQLLVDAGLLQSQMLEVGTSVRVAHALIRAAVYQQTPLPERRALHARAAQILTQESSVLQHRIAAAHQYDDLLAADLEAYAALMHAQRSHRLAARYLTSASRLTRVPSQRERRWLDASFESILANDREPVRAEIPAIERSSDPARKALLLGWLALEKRHSHDAARHFAFGLTDAGAEHLDAITRYRLEVSLAWARLTGGHPTEDVAAGLARVQTLGVQDPALESFALFAEGLLLARKSTFEQVVATLADLPEIPKAVPTEGTTRLALRGSRRANMGVLPGAIRDLQEVAERVQSGVTNFGAGSFHGHLARAYWFSGDWARARINFRLATELTPHAIHPMVLAMLPIIEIGAGDLPGADAALMRAQEVLDDAPWLEACDLLLITRVIRLHAGNSTDEQCAFLRDKGISISDTSSAGVRKSPFWWVHIGLAAVWSGDFDGATICAGELADLPVVSWARAASEWLHGLLAEAQGQGRRALSYLQAATTDASNDLPLYRAHMLVDYARLAHLLNDHSGAAQSLHSANVIYRSLGASPYVHKVEKLLTVTDIVSEERIVTVELTEREHDVLTLVVAGMSYQQIASDLYITQSTVSYHLSNIYAKAAVTSRHELADLVRREPHVLGRASQSA